jgi:hypothetical protein
MGAEQKALFEACMKLVDYFAGRWDKRRDFEWKTTVAIWTLAVGGIYFVKKPEVVPIWAVAIFIAGYAFLWLKRVWDANDAEIQQMIFYQCEADAVMRDPAHVIATAMPYARRKFYNLWLLAELVHAISVVERYLSGVFVLHDSKAKLTHYPSSAWHGLHDSILPTLGFYSVPHYDKDLPIAGVGASAMHNQPIVAK